MSGTHALSPFPGLGLMFCSAALAVTDTSPGPHVTTRSIGMLDICWTDAPRADHYEVCLEVAGIFVTDRGRAPVEKRAGASSIRLSLHSQIDFIP